MEKLKRKKKPISKTGYIQTDDISAPAKKVPEKKEIEKKEVPKKPEKK